MSDKPPYKFFVDARPYESQEAHLSGLAIKQKADINPQYQLYLEEEGDKPDKAISDGETVELKGKDRHFFAVPPATFGCK